METIIDYEVTENVVPFTSHDRTVKSQPMCHDDCERCIKFGRTLRFNLQPASPAHRFANTVGGGTGQTQKREETSAEFLS